MNVSIDNVIRFPVMAAPVTQRVSGVEAAPATEQTPKIVAFRPIEDDAAVDERTQEYGQLFVAHRLVGRVADLLDDVATL